MLARANVQGGETVLVTGASGVSVSHWSSWRQLAARTFWRSRVGLKRDGVRANGAEQILNRDSPDILARIAAAPAGLDVVADIPGGPGLSAMMPVLRDNGRWVIAGAVAGLVIEFDLRRLYLHNVQLIGFSKHTGVHFRRLVELACRGDVRPQVGSTFALTETAEAQRDFSERRHIGKIVLLPHQY